MSPSYSARRTFLPDQAWETSPDFHHGVSVHRDETQNSLGRSHVYTALVETLLGLLYGLSNNCLDYTGLRTLVSIIETPEWDKVLPHFKNVLIATDSKIVQAIAQGLFQQSISECRHRMLDLSLELGADPTKSVRYFSESFRCHVISTPLVGLCDQHSQRSEAEAETLNPEKLIVSLIKRNPLLSNTTLVWLIKAGFYAIAQDVIVNHPERVVDFAIPVSDFEEGTWAYFNSHDPVTPLLVACLDDRKSANKLSLIRCLLERNAKADLEAMIAAAGACDDEVVSVLHQHGAPVNGVIPDFGSPLSSACRAAFRPRLRCDAELITISLLLRLGASPNDIQTTNLDSWKQSPLHILARAQEQPLVTAALGLLIQYGANINHRITVYTSERSGNRSSHSFPRDYEHRPETALEYAVESSQWTSAMQLMSSGCEFTGREILWIDSSGWGQYFTEETKRRGFRQFIRTLLVKAPYQATALHWSGATILQRAIQNEDEDMILALFTFGATPMPPDFLYMLSNRKQDRARVCRLSTSIQLKLMLAASELSVTDVAMIRRILAFACPEVIRHILNSCQDIYDSEGLCYLIVRLATQGKTDYFYALDWRISPEDQKSDRLTMEDLHTFISRRNISNSHQDWERTAVTMAARAGRADILRILTESSPDDLRGSGLMPLFLLKEALVCGPDTDRQSGVQIDHQNWLRLGIWMRYYRMDYPNTRCSPVTAAAMVVPATAAEELVDMLLALNYEPDCWTVLIASSQGRLSILQRLERLECWPHILSHADRPDWCPTALQLAAHGVHMSTVRFLLDTETMMDRIDLSPCRPFCAAMPDWSDVNGYFKQTILPKTALQHAVDKENMQLVTILVNAGANVNAPAAADSGATALQIASIQGSIPMVQYLISQGADCQAAGAARHGRTALQGAAEHGRKDVIELLLSHGALTGYWHREQLLEAIPYAENNAHHVVVGILHESMLPPWSSEDEETLEKLQEDWETSSGNTAFDELTDKFEAWEKTLRDWPESSQACETTSNSEVTSEQPEPLIKNSLAPQENGSWFLQDMEFGNDCREGFDAGQIGETNLYDGDIFSTLASQEDTTAAWVEGQLSLGDYGVDDMLFGDFSFGSFI